MSAESVKAEFDSMWDHLIELATADKTCLADMFVLGARRKAFKASIDAIAQAEPAAPPIMDPSREDVFAEPAAAGEPVAPMPLTQGSMGMSACGCSFSETWAEDGIKRTEYRCQAHRAPAAPPSPAAQQAPSAELCEDCPPFGYPTDKTRCDPCPRRSATEQNRA